MSSFQKPVVLVTGGTGLVGIITIIITTIITTIIIVIIIIIIDNR